MSVEFVWIQTENGMTMMSRAPAPDPKGLFGEEGVTFHDVLDIVNPLQNLPIVGNIYREVTGETIKPGSRLIGGILYGFGPGGIMSAALNNAVEEKTGHDIGGTLIAMAKGESLEHPANLAQTNADAPTQLAAAQTGGADPVDPAWQAYSAARALDAGSVPTNLANAVVPSQTPVATAPAVQLGALPAVEASPATQFPSIQAAAQAMAPTTSAPASASAGTVPTAVVVQPTAQFPSIQAAAPGNAGAVPEMPSSAGLTGLSAHSGLPTAASITPAAAALAAAAAQAQAAHAAGAPAGGSSAPAQSTLAPAAAAPATSDQAAAFAVGRPMANATKFPDGLPVPARINSISPRMPPSLNQQNVGRAPLALSNPVDHRTMDPVTVTPASASATPTPPAPIAAVVTADAPAAAPVQSAAENAVPSPLAPTLVPEAMARALDKYDALMRARRPGGQLDRNL